MGSPVGCTSGNLFNMRLVNLQNYVDCAEPGPKLNNLRTVIRREKMDCTHDASKSLELVRQLIQDAINRDIRRVLDKYTETYLRPAFNNIRENKVEIGEEHINGVLVRALNEAKVMYRTETDAMSGFISPELPASSLLNKGMHLEVPMRARDMHAGESDAESDISIDSNVSRTRKRPARFYSPAGSLNNTPGRGSQLAQAGNSDLWTTEQVELWNPARIDQNTLFILGPRANKILGNLQRGRLLLKYPHMFKYVGDADDKAWLCERGLQGRTSGKTHLLMLDDVINIVHSETELKSGSSVQSCLRQLQQHSFILPEQMRHKLYEFAAIEYERLNIKMMAAAAGADSPFLQEEPGAGAFL